MEEACEGLVLLHEQVRGCLCFCVWGGRVYVWGKRVCGCVCVCVWVWVF